MGGGDEDENLVGGDEDENLVPLCDSCHRRIHVSGALNWAGYLTDLRKKRISEFANRRSNQ